MYAIVTKYVPCTNVRGSRVKAIGPGHEPRKTLTASVEYASHDNEEKAHLAARNAWIDKHCDEKHVFRMFRDSGALRWTVGTLPDGSTVHVPWMDFD